ncbi:hypothetical protein [Kitasatospora sp. NPDC017646]|uniref:hypothetical protein n=1 Tax=Kitasatospora sp. NPDC017646 TaxID=3364024 RepID=UPI0037B585A3
MTDEQETPAGGNRTSFEYKVDLSSATPEALAAIKSDLIRKITENVEAETSLVQLEDASTHDRHYSVHSKDNPQ